MFYSSFICDVCGKNKIMVMGIGGAIFWICPDENCKSNNNSNITYSDNSGV